MAATEFGFSPASFSLAAGTVTVTLRNAGRLPHTFTIDGVVNIVAGAGQTRTETFQIAPGTHTFYCAESGHRGAGMVGSLIVAAGAAPAGAAPGGTAATGHSGHAGGSAGAAAGARAPFDATLRQAPVRRSATLTLTLEHGAPPSPATAPTGCGRSPPARSGPRSSGPHRGRRSASGSPTAAPPRRASAWAGSAGRSRCRRARAAR